MKTYRGRIRIECSRTRANCRKKIAKDIVADCAGCAESIITIVGLNDEPLYVFEKQKPNKKK